MQGQEQQEERVQQPQQLPQEEVKPEPTSPQVQFAAASPTAGTPRAGAAAGAAAEAAAAADVSPSAAGASPAAEEAGGGSGSKKKTERHPVDEEAKAAILKLRSAGGIALGCGRCRYRANTGCVDCRQKAFNQMVSLGAELCLPGVICRQLPWLLRLLLRWLVLWWLRALLHCLACTAVLPHLHGHFVPLHAAALAAALRLVLCSSNTPSCIFSTAAEAGGAAGGPSSAGLCRMQEQRQRLPPLLAGSGSSRPGGTRCTPAATTAAAAATCAAVQEGCQGCSRGCCGRRGSCSGGSRRSSGWAGSHSSCCPSGRASLP
jgi:hypothetical protein